MAKAKILHATRDQAGYHFLVHLDTDWTVGEHEAHELKLPEGASHPHFVRDYHWPNLTPGVHQKFDPAAPHDPQDENSTPALVDMTRDEYEAHIAEMIAQQVAQDLQGLRFYQPAPKPYEVVKSLHEKEI